MKFFSGRLYREAFRQIRSLGILLTVLAGIITALNPIFTYLEDKGSDSNYVNLIDVNTLVTGLVVIATAVPLILLIRLFSFLFKRSSSDFYHALPYTRQCIYFTHLAVAFTWYIIILVVSIGLPVIFYSINPHTTFRPEFASYNFIVGLVVMLFASGAMLIAMSVTGRKMLALEIAAFIAFLPRVIILIGLSVVSSKTLLLDINNVPFFSMKYSLPMILSIGMEMDYSSYMNAYSFVPGIVSTLVVGLIYIILGCVLFSTRRSETAENSAPNRKVQLVLRTVYSSIFFLGGVSCILMDSEPLEVLVLWGLGLLVYFGYELITTKKFKNLLKAIPGLAVSVVMCIAFGVILNVCSDNILNNIPEAKDIESVSVVNSMTYWWGEEMSYNKLLQNEVVVSDKEISNIIAKSYSLTAEKVKADELLEYDADYYCETIRLNYTNGKSNVRVIYMESKDYQDLMAAFLEQKEYYEATYALPDEVIIGRLTNEEYVDNLWKQFKAEYSTLTDEEKDKVLETNDYYGDYYYDDYYYDDEYIYDEDLGSYDYLYVEGYYGIQRFSQDYVLYETLMPKTYQLYREYLYKENYSKVVKMINEMNDGSIESGNINLYTGNTITTDNYYLEGLDIYFNYDDGECYECFFTGGWTEADDLLIVEEDEEFLSDSEEEQVATDGDALPEDDYYYEEEYYYYDDSYWYQQHYVSEEEGLKLANMLLDCYDYKTMVESGKESATFYISCYKSSGFSSSWSDASMNSNINKDKVDELVKYLIENYSDSESNY